MARPRTKTPNFLVCLLLAAPVALAQIKNDFSLYPAGAQGCLDDASESSKCSGATVPEMNACLCSNGGSFITDAARCIGREAQNTLRTVWNSMNTACQDSKTPISVTETDFIFIGQQETPISTTRIATTSTSSPSETATHSESGTASATNTSDPEDDSKLSTGAVAGIGVGSVLGVAIFAGVAAMIWKSRRSRAAHDDATLSMLGSTTPQPPAVALYPPPPGGWRGPEDKASWRPVSAVTDTTSSVVTPSWHTVTPTWQSSPYLNGNWAPQPDNSWPAPMPYQHSGQTTIAEAPENSVSRPPPAIYELSSAEPAVVPPPGHPAIEMPANPAPQHPAPYYQPGSNWAR